MYVSVLISDEREIPRSLERQFAHIALGEQTVFLTADGELHPITAFYLEGDIIPGGAAGGIPLGPGDVAAVGKAVLGELRAPGCDPGGDGEPGRMVILSPGGDAADGCCRESAYNAEKDNEKQRARNVITGIKAPRIKARGFFLF